MKIRKVYEVMSGKEVRDYYIITDAQHQPFIYRGFNWERQTIFVSTGVNEPTAERMPIDFGLVLKEDYEVRDA